MGSAGRLGPGVGVRVVAAALVGAAGALLLRRRLGLAVSRRAVPVEGPVFALAAICAERPADGGAGVSRVVSRVWVESRAVLLVLRSVALDQRHASGGAGAETDAVVVGGGRGGAGVRDPERRDRTGPGDGRRAEEPTSEL